MQASIPIKTRTIDPFSQNIIQIVTALDTKNPYLANELFTSLMPEGDNAQYNKYPEIIKALFTLMNSNMVGKNEVEQEVAHIKYVKALHQKIFTSLTGKANSIPLQDLKALLFLFNSIAIYCRLLPIKMIIQDEKPKPFQSNFSYQIPEKVKESKYDKDIVDLTENQNTTGQLGI